MVGISKEIKIKSVSEYLNEIKNIRPNIDEWGEISRIFYRGQSNKEWNLLPSISRKCLLPKEYYMVKTAKIKKPDEFVSIKHPFNILAKLQHYGLPTRLLDISENPLVALYFACENVLDNEKKETSDIDGIVYYFEVKANEMLDCYSDTANLIALITNLEVNSCMELDSFIDNMILIAKYNSLNIYYKFMDRTRLKDYIKYKLSKTFFVEPEIITERERIQRAAFIIFPNIIENDVVSMRCKDLKQETIKTMKKHLIIPHEYKKEILYELSVIGISKSTLFPELEHFCYELQNDIIKKNL